MRNAVLGLALTLSSISPAGQQQPANVCEMFGAADVAAVIGAGAQPGRQLVPGSCVWAGKGISLRPSTPRPCWRNCERCWRRGWMGQPFMGW